MFFMLFSYDHDTFYEPIHTECDILERRNVASFSQK